MNVFVLDACALIAYLRNEEGKEKLLNLFDTANDSEIKVVMHAAKFAEVYYDFWRVSDKTTANQMSADFSILPIELINTISLHMIQEIGYFKTTYKISFADCFVLSTAKLYGPKVVTSDHHEFDLIDQNRDLEF